MADGRVKVTITVSAETLRAAMSALHAFGLTAEKVENRRACLNAYDELRDVAFGRGGARMQTPEE